MLFRSLCYFERGVEDIAAILADAVLAEYRMVCRKLTAGVYAVPVYLEADAISARSGRRCERRRVDVGAGVVGDSLACVVLTAVVVIEVARVEGVSVNLRARLVHIAFAEREFLVVVGIYKYVAVHPRAGCTRIVEGSGERAACGTGERGRFVLVVVYLRGVGHCDGLAALAAFGERHAVEHAACNIRVGGRVLVEVHGIRPRHREAERVSGVVGRAGEYALVFYKLVVPFIIDRLLGNGDRVGAAPFSRSSTVLTGVCAHAPTVARQATKRREKIL